MKEKISLHRAMAEIKKLEADIQRSFVVAGVLNNKDNTVNNVPKEKFVSEVQSSLDKYVNSCQRLEALKKARNLANSTTIVKIAGEEMTIDQAIIQIGRAHV